MEKFWLIKTKDWLPTAQNFECEFQYIQLLLFYEHKLFLTKKLIYLVTKWKNMYRMFKINLDLLIYIYIALVLAMKKHSD